MYPYFFKLKNSYKIKSFTPVADRVSYGGRISYKHVTTPEKDKLYSIISEPFRNLFGLTVMNITDQVPPHTDTGIKTAINFYIKTENARTIFYKENTRSEKFQIPNQTNGYVFKDDNLTEADSFVALPGEAFVLNVSKIHSVKSSNTINDRVALQLGTDLSFDNVLRILYYTNNLAINTL